jgi:hypothetical protein
VRQLQLLPRIPLPLPDARSNDSGPSHLPSIPLPNPFKAIKSRSVEHLPLTPGNREQGRITLDEEHDVGVLLTEGSLVGLRTRNVGGRLRGLAWSDQSLVVSATVNQTTCIELLFQAFEYWNHGFHIFFISPVTAIQNSKWINDDAYAIAFSVRSLMVSSLRDTE